MTTGKRDREKLKQQKRQEKQRKKEERQSSGSRTFEEMLAYVDENGVLHSTPQDNKPENAIDVNEIQVSIPKQTEIKEDPFRNGIVDFFNTSKGYGFIKESGNNEKYFFHIVNAPSNIEQGDKVTFKIENGARGLNAVEISIIREDGTQEEKV